MTGEVYLANFDPDLPLDDVEDSLMLAAIATEGIHGRSRVRLEVRFQLDRERRDCRIEAGTEAGRNLARIFTGMVSQQFGERTFKLSVERGESIPDGGQDESCR